MREVVVFDIDGVLADMAAALSQVASDLFRVPAFKTSDMTHYNEVRSLLSPLEFNDVWSRATRNPDWWLSIPSLATAEDHAAMETLSTQFDILYLTNRHNKPEVVDKTRLWLLLEGFPVGALWHQADKASFLDAYSHSGVLPYPVLRGVLEDNPYNIAQMQARNLPNVYARRWAFNTECEPHVDSIAEFCEIITSGGV